MSQKIEQRHYDVAVIGGGAAGIAAAISSSRNGARTLLVESGPMVGGDLLSGLPIDGCLNSRGEWIVGGAARELFDGCAQMDGYVGAFSDWRSLWIVCVDPEALNVVIIKTLKKYAVSLLLYSFAEDVVVVDGTVRGVTLVNKSGRTLITADIFIDCTGDGDVAANAGAPYEIGGPAGELQPVSMVFRMGNVDSERLLAFVRDNPDNASLAESPIIKKTKQECAQELYKQGYAKVCLTAKGPLLSRAIEEGQLYPCSILAITPVSLARREVSINSTRRPNVSALNTEDLSESLSYLLDQVDECRRFLHNSVPGFEAAHFAGLAPKIGVRETRRIMGDYVLEGQEVIEGRKREDGIAKGGHHVDIHGSGTSQRLIEIDDGRSYDIPYGCLLPKNIENTLVAGRCLSATREAHSSARVMGTCMATGQAAGTAAALCVSKDILPRALSVDSIREALVEQGAILDGTY